MSYGGIDVRVLRELFDWASGRSVEVILIPRDGDSEDGYVMDSEILIALSEDDGDWGEGISFLIREADKL